MLTWNRVSNLNKGGKSKSLNQNQNQSKIHYQVKNKLDELNNKIIKYDSQVLKNKLDTTKEKPEERSQNKKSSRSKLYLVKSTTNTELYCNMAKKVNNQSHPEIRHNSIFNIFKKIRWRFSKTFLLRWYIGWRNSKARRRVI